jgi:hypothetical protein
MNIATPNPAFNLLEVLRVVGAECLTSALQYHKYGWHPLPLCNSKHVSDGKRHAQKCKSPGKAPLISDWTDALLSEDDLRNAWKQWPLANVGLLMGVGDCAIVGIDIDSEGGDQLLQELSRDDLPPTLEFRRGLTSRRLLYRIPPAETLQNTSRKADNGEVRILASGSQTVAPPSLHVSGERYEWLAGHAPGEIEIALAPAWVCQLARRRSAPRAKSSNGDLALLNVPQGSDQPTHAILTPSLRQRVLAYLSQCPPAISGQHGHDTCFSVARAVTWGFNLGPDTAYQLLAEHYNPRCEPPWSMEELIHKVQDADEKPFDKERGHLLAEDPVLFTIEPTRNGTGESISPPTPEPKPERSEEDSRPVILIDPEEHETNAEAAAALAADSAIFQRGNVLVHVIHGKKKDKGIERDPHMPLIAAVPPAILSERLTAVAKFVGYPTGGKSKKLVRKHPPERCISAVLNRGYWPGVRHLEGVVDSPVLGPDGSILVTPGYDELTGLVFEPSAPFLPIPTTVTLEDAEAARSELLHVICDFPFAEEVHKAAWLASLLTPLARFAFYGPAPMFAVDANVPGSGKGLLVDITSRIVTGRPAAITTMTEKDEEFRKRITSIALAGDQLVTIDNVNRPLDHASLDAVLTCTSWRDRLLGENSMTAQIPMRTTWFCTGNNIEFGGDLPRRICHIRLECREEHPEDRQGFKHPDLSSWVRQERGRLLRAGLTVLKGYYDAGQPDMGLTPWGSFEEWSKIVRNAIVWCGLPDPGKTRQEVRRRSDSVASWLPALFDGLEVLDTERKGLRVSEIVEKLEDDHYNKDDRVISLKEAIVNLCYARGDFPTTKAIGKKFQHLEGRVCGGFYLTSGNHKNTRVWRVQKCSAV